MAVLVVAAFTTVERDCCEGAVGPFKVQLCFFVTAPGALQVPCAGLALLTYQALIMCELAASNVCAIVEQDWCCAEAVCGVN